MEERLRVGRLTLLPASRRLLLGDAPVSVGGRAFDLLVCLARHRDRVVTKAELLDAAWPDACVIDNNLSAQIVALRRVLGADAVVTVAGVGYRLGGATLDDEAPSSGDRAELAVTPSVAVLPFVNLSGDPGEVHFADGVAEDILVALARFESIRVVARSSSFSLGARGEVPAERAAERLGVRYVLDGSVRRSATELRIGVQLVEARGGIQLWAARFDRPLADLFAVQDDIAAHVASAIEPAVRAAEIARARRVPPASLAAYDLYLRALPHLYAMRPEDCAAARALLERAIGVDPGFAAARAYLAWGYEQALSRQWPGVSERDRPVAVSHAREALTLAGDDASTVGVAGFVLVTLAADHDAGLAALRRAATRNPNNALVANLAGTANLFAGDLTEARAHLQRVRVLSPSDPAAFMWVAALACVELLLDRPDVALGQCAESAALHPEWTFTWWVMAAAAGELGDARRAREALAHLCRLDGVAELALPRFRVFADANRRDRLLRGLRKAGLSRR